MKSFFIVSFLIVVILDNLFAEIRNGYEKDIQQTRISLQSLKNLLSVNKDLTAWEKRTIKARIKSMTEYLTYHDVTEVLLDKLRDISPYLYQEIDTLKDRKGRRVDVYVKFLSGEENEFKIPGMVSFYTSRGDVHRCISEYGQGSVSVLVWISNNSLLILSHEFGHLKYIVPNLSSYFRFYKRASGSSCAGGSLGHSAGDLSGLNALRFEKRFRVDYFRYRKVNSKESVSPLTLLVRSRSNVVKSQDITPLATNGWAAPAYRILNPRVP